MCTTGVTIGGSMTLGNGGPGGLVLDGCIINSGTGSVAAANISNVSLLRLLSGPE